MLVLTVMVHMLMCAPMGIGLPQWSVKQRRHGSVGVCTPVRRWEVATPSPVRWPSARPIGVMACPPLWPLSCHEV